MQNKYEFKGSKFPWHLSPAILQIYSSANDEKDIDSGHAVCKVTRGEWGDEYPVLKQFGDSDLIGIYKAEIERIVYGNTPEEIAEANAQMIKSVGLLFNACVNFINKVDNGQAKSVKSYAEMKFAVESALGLNKE